jgi:hypothetical protein
MQLPLDGTGLSLAGGLLLSASYQPQEVGSGWLNLQCVGPVTYDPHTTSIQLAPWSPEGYRVEQGLGNKALVVCGAPGIMVIELSSLRVTAAFALEYEECEPQGLPWFVHGSGVMLITTERRIFCVDQRLAFRWCWTVAAYSNDRWEISRAPVLEGNTIQIYLMAPLKTAVAKLDLFTGARLPE